MKIHNYTSASLLMNAHFLFNFKWRVEVCSYTSNPAAPLLLSCRALNIIFSFVWGPPASLDERRSQAHCALTRTLREQQQIRAPPNRAKQTDKDIKTQSRFFFSKNDEKEEKKIPLGKITNWSRAARSNVSPDNRLRRTGEFSAVSGIRQDPRRARYVTASGGCSLESFPFPFLMTA